MIIQPFSKTYRDRCVLQFPGGEFRPGTAYAVIGPNGSGKSTFANIVAGIYPSDQGDAVTAKIETGFLPQHPYAFRMSVRKNLLLNGEGTKDEKKERARKLMDSLSLNALSSKNAASLSGGETARMALARLLMKKYRLLILDEPCASMDIASTFQTENLIREYLRETEAVLFLITHSLRQAQRLADETLLFNNGILLERDRTEQLLNHPQTAEAKEYLAF